MVVAVKNDTATLLQATELTQFPDANVDISISLSSRCCSSVGSRAATSRELAEKATECARVVHLGIHTDDATRAYSEIQPKK